MQRDSSSSNGTIRTISFLFPTKPIHEKHSSVAIQHKKLAIMCPSAGVLGSGEWRKAAHCAVR